MDTATDTFLNGAQFLQPETTTAMFAVECYWFMGGVLVAFAFCAFCTIIRAVRSGAGNTDV